MNALRDYFEAQVARLEADGELRPVAEMKAAKLTRVYADGLGASHDERVSAFCDYPEILPRPDPKYDANDVLINSRDISKWMSELSSLWAHMASYQYFVRNTITDEGLPMSANNVSVNREIFPLTAAIVDQFRAAFGADQVAVEWCKEGENEIGAPKRGLVVPCVPQPITEDEAANLREWLEKNRDRLGLKKRKKRKSKH